ncbi:MAG: hypothetical protein FJ225_07350 [Lentisphaerae bacterium]|nr:hypothetical protein [Lentisphaerota bacterium]
MNTSFEPTANACVRLHRATRYLIDACAVSDGVVDTGAWLAAGAPHICSAESARFHRPPRVLRKTLAQRMAEDDWRFASTPGGVESLEASHSTAEALYLWGDLAQLSTRNRQAWVNSLNRWQDEASGYFLGPYVLPADHAAWKDPRQTHPWMHMQDHLLSVLVPCLLMLGGQPRFRLSRGSQSGRFLDRAYLEHFLERDWSGYRDDGDYARHNPWWMGNEFWYPGCILWAISVCECGTPAAERARQLLDQVWYAWHDANFNECGFWAGTLSDDPVRHWRSQGTTARDRIHWAAIQVMGGAHQLWLYDHERHPIPPEVRRRQTDTVLSLQAGDGHFGLYGADEANSQSTDCTDVDCLTLLAYNLRADDYRRAEVRAACDRAASAILRDKIDAHGVLASRPGEGWAHHGLSPETYSPPGAPNLHQQGFYLWAVLAAVSGLEGSADPAVQSFIDHPWPLMPTHWLWVPGRFTYLGTEGA